MCPQKHGCTSRSVNRSPPAATNNAARQKNSNCTTCKYTKYDDPPPRLTFYDLHNNTPRSCRQETYIWGPQFFRKASSRPRMTTPRSTRIFPRANKSIQKRNTAGTKRLYQNSSRKIEIRPKRKIKAQGRARHIIFIFVSPGSI